MLHCGKFKKLHSLKFPDDPLGIDFIFLDPWGMLNCHSSVPFGIKFSEELPSSIMNSLIVRFQLVSTFEFKFFCTFMSGNFTKKHLVFVGNFSILKITSKCLWWACIERAISRTYTLWFCWPQLTILLCSVEKKDDIVAKVNVLYLNLLIVDMIITKI